ncbi:hypothetical protein [Raineyella fluvialis]|uniref:Uncharacterized protein n=1 Tax=Raineyella fluvialis TaxID=2662261 RepID=A0A5Q2F9L7_9ACTN|nr:hypothetical protein [Raineyella fluvialis]QGF22437.1 hypothetical protein Rai3103_00635 [Raineyella fluvialis]
MRGPSFKGVRTYYGLSWFGMADTSMWPLLAGAPAGWRVTGGVGGSPILA